jgi:hypothetical protein
MCTHLGSQRRVRSWAQGAPKGYMDRLPLATSGQRRGELLAAIIYQRDNQSSSFKAEETAITKSRAGDILNSCLLAGRSARARLSEPPSPYVWIRIGGHAVFWVCVAEQRLYSEQETVG